MRAAVFQGVGRPLVVETIPDPAPEDDEVLIRVHNCGVCGSDLHMTMSGVLTVPEGTVLGHEFSGEIVALGRHAGDGWSIGDRVTAMPFRPCRACGQVCKDRLGVHCDNILGIGAGQISGGFAEYVRCGVGQVLKLPERVDFILGALVEPLAVGLHAVRKSGLSVGASVLIVGGGPVGLAVAAFCRLAGAGAIIISEPADERRSRAEALGDLTGTIDPTRYEPAVEFHRLAGRSPDFVFECVGMPGLFQNVLTAAPHFGKVIIVGACLQEDRFIPFTALPKELSVQFVFAYEKSDFSMVLDFLQAGRFDPAPMVTEIVSLDQFPTAFEALRQPTTQCKILVAPKR